MYTLIVFAKLPILGEVKTRIAAQSTDEFALNLYEYLLSACLLQAQLAAQDFSRLTGEKSQVHWHYSGNLDHASETKNSVVQSFLARPELMFLQSPSKDLGVRMAGVLKAYEGPSILFGSDIPTLVANGLVQAMLAVQKAPNSIVINPTRDGGYCLIGRGAASTMNDQVFTDIAWSTPIVMHQTRMKLLSLNIRWKELDPLSDIDDLDAAHCYLTR
jgi:uncharacterized protein